MGPLVFTFAWKILCGLWSFVVIVPFPYISSQRQQKLQASKAGGGTMESHFVQSLLNQRLSLQGIRHADDVTVRNPEPIR